MLFKIVWGIAAQAVCDVGAVTRLTSLVTLCFKNYKESQITLADVFIYKIGVFRIAFSVTGVSPHFDKAFIAFKTVFIFRSKAGLASRVASHTDVIDFFVEQAD
jgi:hypothetical protein